MQCRRGLSIVFACIVAGASCTPSRTGQRRAVLGGEADWLRERYAARAKQCAEGSALWAAYRQAEETCVAVARACDTLSAFVDDRHHFTQVERELQDARKAVAEAEANEAARKTLTARIGARVREFDKELAGRSVQDAHRAEIEKVRTAYSDLSQVLAHAATPAALADAVATASARLSQDQQADPALAAAARHGRVKALVEAELAKVTNLLAAEKAKQPDSSRVGSLERANASLQEAKVLTAPSTTPDPLLLDTAEKALNRAREAVAKAEQDPLVYPSPWFRAHAGAISLSPYRVEEVPANQNVEGQRFQLARASTSPEFYAELDFHGREAWLAAEDRLERTPDYGLRFLPDWLVPDDYEARLRLVNNTTIDSQATAVGGDIAVETLVGWNIVGIGLHDAATLADEPALKKRPRGTLNFEFGTGFSTDRDVVDTHGYVVVGLGTAWAFPMQVATSTFRTATVYTGLYYGAFDYPQLDVDDVQYIDAHRPAFNSLGSIGARIDAAIPISGSLDAVVGIRYWDAIGSDDAPESWSVFVGVSIPVGKILKAATDS